MSRAARDEDGSKSVPASSVGEQLGIGRENGGRRAMGSPSPLPSSAVALAVARVVLHAVVVEDGLAAFLLEFDVLEKLVEGE